MLFYSGIIENSTSLVLSQNVPYFMAVLLEIAQAWFYHKTSHIAIRHFLVNCPIIVAVQLDTTPLPTVNTRVSI